jgi:hypothetical protein
MASHGETAMPGRFVTTGRGLPDQEPGLR